MSIAERVNADLPLLRRFARSLTGSQEVGDSVVVATLEDATASVARPNMPGTVQETNWSVPLSETLEELMVDPRAAAIAETLNLRTPSP